MTIRRAAALALILSTATTAPAQTPGPAVSLTVIINANQSLTLEWAPPLAGGEPLGYIVQIGTTSFGSDTLSRQIGNVTTFTNLSWGSPRFGGPPLHYQLEAGTAPGSLDIGTLDLSVDRNALRIDHVPNGTYYARIRAVNVAGASDPSNEVTVVVCGPGCTTPPGAVTQLSFQTSGRDVLLMWRGPTTGAAPTGYVIEVGTGPGLANLGQFPTGSTAVSVFVPNAPPGAYFVRVRAAVNDVRGPASNEVFIQVP